MLKEVHNNQCKNNKQLKNQVEINQNQIALIITSLLFQSGDLILSISKEKDDWRSWHTSNYRKSVK